MVDLSVSVYTNHRLGICIITVGDMLYYNKHNRMLFHVHITITINYKGVSLLYL
jgi:hypothetical protein